MTTPEQLSTVSSRDRNTKNTIVAGLALIIIGLVVLAVQFLDTPAIGLLILPTLAVIFLAWGLITRTFGLIIPGGILAGIGAGVFLMETGTFAAQGEGEAAVFLLAFAGGWALISLLSFITEHGFQWWPLIPGGIIAAVGALLMAGAAGLQVLELSQYLWPVALIVVGISIILRRNTSSS